MLQYFPFLEQFDLKMGIRPYGAHDHLIEIDDHYFEEIQLKHELLTREHDFYFRAQSETMPA